MVKPMLARSDQKKISKRLVNMKTAVYTRRWVEKTILTEALKPQRKIAAIAGLLTIIRCTPHFMDRKRQNSAHANRMKSATTEYVISVSALIAIAIERNSMSRMNSMIS